MATFVAFGVLFSFGVFLTPIAETFGTTSGPVAPLFSGAVLFYYLAGAVGGRLGDRHGVRPVLAVGAVALAGGLIATSRATTLWQTYLFFIPLVGTGVGCCYSPLIGSVGRWFERRRVLAVGILLTGVGGGTLVMPIASRELIEAFGWQTTFAILGVVAAVAVGAAAVVASSPPVDGAAAHVDTRAMARSPRLRRLYLSVVIIGPAFYAPLAFFNDYAISAGISGRSAASLVGIVGAASVVARLIYGTVGHRVEPIAGYRLGYVLMTVSLVVWLLARSSHPALVASAVALGIGWGVWVTATPLVLADWFGLRSLGGMLGTFYTGLGIGALAGPALSGFVIDRAGYRPAIAAAVVAGFVATAVVMSPRLGDDQPIVEAAESSGSPGAFDRGRGEK